ncbi:MAG: type II secretion system protein M [bacterium]|nr:type II secretion system protein M [bacterium]MCP5066764.1 type II secretion system protein M [bacterium]
MKPVELKANAIARYEALSQRERWLVAVACLAAVYCVISFGLIDPLMREREGLLGQLEAAADQLGKLNGEVSALSARLQSGPGARLNRQEKELQLALERLEEKLAERQTRLVSPAEAARVLEELLAAERELRLVRLETAEPKPVGAEDLEPGAASGRPALYRHDIVLETEGRYFAALRYLQALETGGSGVRLDQLDYQVTTHPDARVVLRLFTLSFEKEWIGV